MSKTKDTYKIKRRKYLKIIILLLIIIYSVILFKIYIYLVKIKYEISNIFKNNSNQQIITKLINNIMNNNIIHFLEKASINYLTNTDYTKKTIITHEIQQYIMQQNDFCENPKKYYNQGYEDLIVLTNFSFMNLSYQIYVYKKFDNYMSNGIIRTGKYEPFHMSNFLKVLRYYSIKNKIKNNNDIFILDIGGNIGAYPSFLGRLGYSILSFEASPRNYYILRKNYCLINNNSNVIIINKGISNEEKKCNYYSQIDGIGNGILLCDENKNEIKSSKWHFKKTFDVNLTIK